MTLQPTPEPSADQSVPNTPIDPGTKPLKYKNILCIEDEHFISELYTRALTKAGYNVKIVIDGKQGLEEAKKNIYDIILLDIMVPTMTGVEVLKHLRDATETPNLKAKVIITTNLEQSEDSRAQIEKQADGYIVKANVTPKQLADILHSLE
jgi:CheY-like chemotaxis protein